MTTIMILPESEGAHSTAFRAVAGDRESRGRTPGEALDALTPQLTQDEKGTLVIVQHWREDAFFTKQQQQCLTELMARWREARDSGRELPPDEQAELNRLID